jgi:hypothetical protein
MNKIYKNNHLIEVNCGFHFDLNDSRWDSTYFGQFYDKIKDFGFKYATRAGITWGIDDIIK